MLICLNLYCDDDENLLVQRHWEMRVLCVRCWLSGLWDPARVCMCDLRRQLRLGEDLPTLGYSRDGSR